MFGDYSIGDLGAIFAMQGFAGLILFSVYVLMALGLAIIFGQMGVINMAHGEFLMAGAYTTYVTQAAYLGPWLWKLTVEKAGSFDNDKIAAASPGIEFKGAPEGYVRIHENHHLWSKTRVGKARLDGQFDVVYETADLVQPDPFPKGYQ